MSAMDTTLLRMDELGVMFTTEDGVTNPVRSVSICIAPGERVAMVGESGCGKSLTALSIARLAPTDRARVTGRLMFDGEPLDVNNPMSLARVRGKGIAYVFQDATASLNPVMRIANQMRECLSDVPRHAQDATILDLLARTGLPDPRRAARAYPCELSGGQQQRVMLAMALAARPKLLIADEPTTALDVTTQRQVLDLMDTLADETGMAVLFITHNLGLVARRMERVYVMYAGQVVESGPVMDVLHTPKHPYTQGLLQAVPMLDAPRGAPLTDIPGTVPAPDAWPAGCAFAPRCPHATDACHATQPVMNVQGTRAWACNRVC